MAFQQGNATDYLDLLDQFTTFVTGLGGGQAWTVLKNTTTGFTVDGEVYYRAPGLSGLDEIYMNVQTFSDGPSAHYLWRMQGAVGFDTLLDFNDQPGSIPVVAGVPRMLLSNGAMAYTFVANGQRAVIVVNVSTVIESCYIGWITPYGPPSDFPQPLFIGAMHNEDEQPSDTNDKHTWWLMDRRGGVGIESTAHMRTPNGQWARARELSQAALQDTELRFFTNPHAYIDAFTQGGSNMLDVTVTENNEYIRTPVMVIANINAGVGDAQEQPLGQFDDVFHVIGTGLSQDDEVQCGGVDHLVFQNAFRTDINSFACVGLQ